MHGIFASLSNKLVDAYQESIKRSLAEDTLFPDLDHESLTLKSFLDNGSRNLSVECFAGLEKTMNSTNPATGLPLILRMVDAMGKNDILVPGILKETFMPVEHMTNVLTLGQVILSTVLLLCR